MHRGRRGSKTRQQIHINGEEAEPEKDNLIFNLTGNTLHPDEVSLLNKGLSFVPSKPADCFVTKIELFKFFRNLRLKTYYKDTTSSQIYNKQERGKFKPTSTFCPPIVNPSLDTFCRLVERDVEQLFSNPHPHNGMNNLTLSERQALDKLCKDKNIVVKPADKGGGLVIMPKTLYDQEVLRQLQDLSYYRALPTDPTSRFQKEIELFLQQAHSSSLISEREFQYLFNRTPTRPAFYILPKVHKNLSNPPGRPIVAGNNSLTEPLSNFVDFILRPLITLLPSYLKDTSDFLKCMSQISHLGQDVLLATMDVTSLYTNIPHTDGLTALKYFLDLRTNDDGLPTKFIVDMSELVLTKNYFLFEHQYYLQISGTAMGATMAPDYANLYLGFLEEQYVFNNNPFLEKIILFKRYIDDCFVIFHGSLSEFELFVLYMNCLRSSIKYTYTASATSVNFLDTCISVIDGHIVSSLYRKDTEKNSLLHATSAHPTSLKRGLPFSQFTRLHRICSDKNDFEVKARLLYRDFNSRGYPNNWLDTALNKVRASGTHSSNLVSKQNENRCILKLTHSPLSREIRNIVNSHWHIIKSDYQLNGLFQNLPLCVFSRSSNLRDRLVHADIATPPSGTLSNAQGNFPCKSCTSCIHYLKLQSFTHPHTRKIYKIKQLITCKSTHVVYILICPCPLLYVGKTIRALRTRILEHLSAIRRCDATSSVSQHFQLAKHAISDLKFLGIERVLPKRRGGDVDKKLLQRESFWIFELNSLFPKGMNEEINYSCFL